MASYQQRRRDTTTSERSAASRSSRKSADSYESRSTAPTSLYESPASSMKYSTSKAPRSCDEDVSPATSLLPRASVDTYSSEASSYQLPDDEAVESFDYSDIPPLPVYHKEIAEPNVLPSSPEGFAALFPSMNRLSIRHDDFTPDGNMNLRVDTVVQGSRRKKTIQLFHLRMYDLNKREFSLRRYCRDSGREVCNSKRKFIEPATQSRPTLQRSMSSAMKNFTGRPQIRRAGTAGSIFSTKSRPGTSYSTSTDGTSDDLASNFDRMSLDHKPKNRPEPTNCIKLEFSNYARVDVQRKGSGNSKRYEFDWWGHKYSWKRVVEKHLDMVSFHLMRDGNNTPVAHIVPETRSPNQVDDDETAGGWVPPCHMWISDENILNAMTDVADVIMASGLIALVDDCIKNRWQSKKVHRIPLPLTQKSVDVEYIGPRAFVQHMFSRHNSAEHDSKRYRQVEAAY